MVKEGNIAIDGPAGAGKSTVAKLVAEELGYLYVDTGAMYRALTWKAIKQGIEVNNSEALVQLAAKTEIVLMRKHNTKAQVVMCDGQDVTSAIRSPEVSNRVSQVAQIPFVREILAKEQRKMAATNNVVMDGRDIGSNVLPDATFKFFLTASLHERTRRRHQELCLKGYNIDFEKLSMEIAKRDAMDSQRETAPLIRVPEAIEIDTSTLTPEQVAEKIIQLVTKS